MLATTRSTPTTRCRHPAPARRRERELQPQEDEEHHTGADSAPVGVPDAELLQEQCQPDDDQQHGQDDARLRRRSSLGLSQVVQRRTADPDQASGSIRSGGTRRTARMLRIRSRMPTLTRTIPPIPRSCGAPPARPVPRARSGPTASSSRPRPLFAARFPGPADLGGVGDHLLVRGERPPLGDEQPGHHVQHEARRWPWPGRRTGCRMGSIPRLAGPWQTPATMRFFSLRTSLLFMRGPPVWVRTRACARVGFTIYTRGGGRGCWGRKDRITGFRTRFTGFQKQDVRGTLDGASVGHARC